MHQACLFYKKSLGTGKTYAKSLVNKIEIFEKHFKTKKQIFLTLITTFGTKETIWSQELVGSELTMDVFFKL